MKNALLKLITSIILLAAGSTAALALSKAGLNRPTGVPADYVITPFGYFHPSCVVQLAQGDSLRRSDKIVRHANGSSSPMHSCDHPHFRADGEKVIGDEAGLANPDISHAWVEYASDTTKSAYGQLYAEWSVPPTPASKDGQTLFYFPGMEDIDDVVTIIQPVLGWNSDYASSWGIASWNCCESGTTYEATPQRVNPGDTILGYMVANCPAGTKTCDSWDIVTLDLQNGLSSELPDTSNFGQTFNWAFGGVMEVYNVSQCSDYPSNGGLWGGNSLSFHDIGLYNAKLKQVKPKWDVSITGGLTPQCNYSGSIPSQVIINY